MTEARRHSVDIPLSRTLVALKRVRSLRDPDTSSLSKLAALVDHMNLETSSCNGAIFGLGNNKHSSRHKGACRREGRKVDSGTDTESDCNPLAPDAKAGFAKCSAKNARVHDSCGGYIHSSLDSKRVPRPTSYLEKELDSCQDKKLEQVLKLSRYDTLGRSCSTKEGALMCNARIPCTCAGEACTRALSHKALGEKVEFVFPNNAGCGVSCCWSREPKCHDLKLPSDVECQEFQLNSQLGKESVYARSALYQDSSMNLSEKYRPKSFHELVGQNEVAQSLLDTILNGNVGPIYLFHGPRGTGKTSAAKIFAAALNCQSGKQHWPCGFCEDCKLAISGRSRDVVELDASETNHKDGFKILSECVLVPFSSPYKVFIIDDCELLQRSMWAAIYKSIEELSRHVVFIMITSDLDKLPSSILSWCQRYHFLKIKNDDIVVRLEIICIQEALEFEEDALLFLASESNGSLREAITMLDQLALLGKKITTSLAYELMGVISDDDLLDLLHLALSSDTSGTVRRARELMSSGIDPMQLTSQLAKFIMDILSGQSGSSRFFAEAGMEKLRHALKILVETEKQLRTSKDQSTWFTAALLQFNTGESFPPTNMNDLEAPRRVTYSRDSGQLAISSPKESLNGSIHVCSHHISNSEAHYDEARELGDIWRRTIENCQSSSLKSFLRKEGRLSSVHIYEGLAVAEVEFCHPHYASKAEESWELIVGPLQTVLGCNVDMRISLVPSSISSTHKQKSLFSLFCCSGRKQETSYSTITNKKDFLPSGRKVKVLEFCSSHHKSLHGSNSVHQEAAVTTNDSDGYGHISGNTMFSTTVQDDLSNECKDETDPSKEVCEGGQYMNAQEIEDQPKCSSQTLNFRRSGSADAAHATSLGIQQLDKLKLFDSKKTCFEENFCTNEPNVVCSNSNEQNTYNTEEEDRPNMGSKFCPRLHCCRASMRDKKAWQRRQQDHRRCRLVSWIVPCASDDQLSLTTAAEVRPRGLQQKRRW